MTARMSIQRTMVAAFMLALLGTAHGQQQAAVDGLIVDTLVVPGPELAQSATSATLIAPDLLALRKELPGTSAPAEIIQRAERRRSDVNGDGIIDERDLEALTAARGPCADRSTGCAGDVNGDGVVDDADFATVQQHLGVDLRGSADAYPEQVGYNAAAPADLLPRLPDPPRADGWRVAKVELHSADAIGLRLQFAGLAGTPGLEVRIYDPAGTTVLGPYVSPRRAEDGTWWSPIIFGDTIGVELALAPGLEVPAVLPRIVTVSYLFCDGGTQCHGTPGTPMACHNDITCNASWAGNEGRAVAMIYFNSGSGCSRCSGALLNRGPGDFSPLFMTAHHCISTQAEADTVEVFWHYNTPTCNGTPPNYNTLLRSDGAILLKRHPGTDWTLLGLLQSPQTNVYLGWDANNWTSGNAATGVHHPRGTFKRISTGTSAGSTDGALFCGGGTVPCTCNGSPSTCFAVDDFNVSYTSGTTEPGSSGSPAFDSSRRVRGTLTGGPDGCATITARYGRFDRALVNLRYFLNDPDVPVGAVFVNGGVAGDPGNNGNTERGTAANPFNTVAEATFCVRAGEELRITPGNYNERFTILRPMVLRRDGTSGIVTMGN